MSRKTELAGKKVIHNFLSVYGEFMTAEGKEALRLMSFKEACDEMGRLHEKYFWRVMYRKNNWVPSWYEPEKNVYIFSHEGWTTFLNREGNIVVFIHEYECLFITLSHLEEEIERSRAIREALADFPLALMNRTDEYYFERLKEMTA